MMQALVIEREEPHLVKRAAAGDLEAFDLLVLRHSDRVYRLALRMLGNREDAEDIQQEAFVCAYKGLRKFRGDASFGTWIYSITARLCLSKRRRFARRPSEKLEDLSEIPCSSDQDPERTLLIADASRQIQQVLSDMAPSDRLLIVLKLIEGLTHEEIAPVLGCSMQSCRSRLVRAKRIFRERYEQMENVNAKLR